MTDGVDTSGGAGALAEVSTALAALRLLAGAGLWQLPDADLARLAGLLDQVRRLADGQTVRLLGEVDSRGLPGQDGTGSPGAWLRRMGLSVVLCKCVAGVHEVRPGPGGRGTSRRTG